ncbi:MAG: SDR family oxidoreductase [Rhodospirillaceae bacterium]|jgi:NAD(P)-dependent dehydrogenase (short-subunit alcohol dehydrogenase family)|nr:SDR family oxidoreductase [Rhodospirillaceae bacterium]MBT5458678.1 SDR family oxidoreductase [Rhodospirillaceae bacterium]
MNDPSLVDKIVIVTGAGSGLGRAMALALAESGCHVVAVDNIAERLDDLAARADNLPGGMVPLCADLRELENCSAIVEKTLSEFGAVHGLVNCAGVSIAIIRPEFRRDNVMFWEVPDDKWQVMFDLNATAPFLLAKAVAPHMIAQKWGRIVNVTTSLDTMIRPAWTPYGPSKAALEAASSNWAGDLDGKGVTVNVLIPGGPANTDFVPGVTDEERAKLVQPETMGEPVKWLMSDASENFTARRILASNWDDNLAPPEAADQASASIAWRSIGRQAATEPVPR